MVKPSGDDWGVRLSVWGVWLSVWGVILFGLGCVSLRFGVCFFSDWCVFLFGFGCVAHDSETGEEGPLGGFRKT